MATISARNQSEQSNFDDKLAGEIAAEGLDMDRDWYLREEEGGMDETDGGFHFQDESTYKRGKPKHDNRDEGKVRSFAIRPVFSFAAGAGICD